ncbi:MAG: CbtB domain-containing protein [Alphaproteobacteria bacterium]
MNNSATQAKAAPAQAAILARPQMAALTAIFFGILLIAGAGFAQSSVLHDATHDTRHAFGLPCH